MLSTGTHNIAKQKTCCWISTHYYFPICWTTKNTARNTPRAWKLQVGVVESVCANAWGGPILFQKQQDVFPNKGDDISHISWCSLWPAWPAIKQWQSTVTISRQALKHTTLFTWPSGTEKGPGVTLDSKTKSGNSKQVLAYVWQWHAAKT